VRGGDGGGPRSSELLGFDRAARVLVVSCDDLGMDEGINAGIVEAIDHGIASSCSLMPTAPAAAQAMDRLRERPDIPFGVHLTLVRDRADARWGPAAEPRLVSSLLDGGGELFTPSAAGRSALLGRARIEEVEVELRAQLELVLGARLEPTHLDFHCLADGGRDDIRDLAVRLALEHGLALRVWLEPARDDLRRAGLPVPDNDFLDSFSLDADQGDDKAAAFAQLLRDLPEGLSEWAVHPSARRTDPGQPDDDWRVRSTDHAFLVSGEASTVIADEGIVILDYRPLQRVWAACGESDRGRAPGHEVT
jgi:predicted glycoside hydrolase/deacetylase ChbG (UPF0249 family)